MQVVAIAGALFTLSFITNPVRADPSSSATIDFVRDVQPIFASTCYRCHGPDTQKANLRLDVREIALKGGDDAPVIRPGP